MAQQRKFKTVAALAAAAANILNGAVTALTGPVGVTFTQPRIQLKHIRILNKTGAAATFSLFVGATAGSAAGTEFGFGTNSVPANSYVDWYGDFEMDSTDFLTGFASAATTLTINIEFEAGFA